MKNARSVLHSVYAEYVGGNKDVSKESLMHSINYVLQNSSRSEDKALAYFLRANLLTGSKLDDSAKWMDDMARGCVEVDKTKNHNLAASIYLDYGIELNSREWFDLAVPALQRALQEAKKEQMPQHEVFALMNLSRARLREDKGEEGKIAALEYAKAAVQVAQDYSQMTLYAKALFALSSCYRELGMNNEALEVAIETASLMEFQSAQGLREEPVSYFQVAKSYCIVGPIDSAIVYAQKELNHPGLRERMSANKLLAFIYCDSLGDKSKAREYKEAFHILRDSLNIQQQNDKVLSDRIALAEELIESRRKRSRDIILVSIVAMVAVCGTLVSVFLRRAKKNKEDFSKEQADLKRRLADSDSLVCELKEKARYLDEQEWAHIFSIVDETYDGYCSELSSQGLTRNNIRLASLIRLGFSTSECAVLLGISPSSVTKAKQRLKSKISC